MRQLSDRGIGSIEYDKNDATKHKQSWFKKITFWPLPPFVALALIPLLPQPLYLNRGYTVWFHLTSLFYLLTQSSFVRKVLILQGTGICLGWYSAIAADWFTEGTFCHTLYRNMPASMVEYMVQEAPLNSTIGEHAAMAAMGIEPITGNSSYILLDTYSSYAMKALSHVLDTMGHPGLAYLFWKIHKTNHQSTSHGASLKTVLNDILSWEVIVFGWHFSRSWSLLHSYYNTGQPSFWYYGHDVYLLNNLDSYLIAYIAEGACFGVAILLRLWWDCNRCSEGSDISGSGLLQRSQSSTKIPPMSSSLPVVKNSMEQTYYESVSREQKKDTATKPELIHSDSAVSTLSMM
eukprot:CAMPEP_0183723358 /NCGR_PEP_ID=MMETSP0737-20130205/14950_1 /TAXON_ID=385413 /ORGANISM="Thalassiosira miniscula, Strain CCMP1093" /LENGTH=347 /DNA_ID=CAMNT_0025953619 /DNA_START=104 /DNA_END=1147 /DNA_ORIENTATION=+